MMERIRAEVEKRKAASGPVGEKSLETEEENVQVAGGEAPSEPATVEGKEAQRIYGVSELYALHDINFLRNGYRTILLREASVDEIQVWLPRLRSGELGKKEILAQLRYGGEGRQKKVVVSGLLLPFLFNQLFKLPILGKPFRIVACVAHLPTVFRNLRRMEYSVNNRYDQLHEHVGQVRNHVQAVDAALAKKANWVNVGNLSKGIQETSHRVKLTSIGLREVSERMKELGTRLVETDSQARERDEGLKKDINNSLMRLKGELNAIEGQARDYKLNILAQQRRLDDLLAREPSPGETTPHAGSQSVPVSQNDHSLNALYVTFEDRFRGTREDIKERQRVYLPYVQKVQEKTGTGMILDVGCGRGEWLELLAESNYSAKGVDLNTIMVAESKELGLDVEEGDVFDYFKDMASESLSVVTGFHIVEHLPLKVMLALFDQAYRVLKPGGMVIFETPNPENILVGSCNFYYDPTHKNPIPPEVLSFLLDARGYRDIEIVRLHENPHYLDLKESNISEKITSRFYGPQDYSVIGYK